MKRLYFPISFQNMNQENSYFILWLGTLSGLNNNLIT